VCSVFVLLTLTENASGGLFCWRDNVAQANISLKKKEYNERKSDLAKMQELSN
jgi:hypothetical protein